MEANLTPPNMNDGVNKTVRYTFKKCDRLASNLKIAELAKEGESFNHYPFRVSYKLEQLIDKNQSSIQVAIAVPKRNHKRAVARNYVKRRIREAYRLHIHSLRDLVLQQHETKLLILISYISPELLPFQKIEEELIILLSRLTKRVKKAAGSTTNPAG